MMNKQRNDRTEFSGILRSALKDDSNVLIERKRGKETFQCRGPGKAGPSPSDLIWAPQERGSARHQGHSGGDTDPGLSCSSS